MKKLYIIKMMLIFFLDFIKQYYKAGFCLLIKYEKHNMNI